MSIGLERSVCAAPTLGIVKETVEVAQIVDKVVVVPIACPPPGL